jgi:hypothetical protein
MSKYRLNVRPETAVQLARHPVLAPRPVGSSISLPNTGVLRARGLVPAPYDQGAEGSCTGNASAGAVKIVRKAAGFADWDPARQFIYGEELAMNNELGQDAGANPGDAVIVLTKTGICSEATFPYLASDALVQPPAAAIAEAAGHKLVSYAALSTSIEAMLESLAQGKPVTFAFHVPESFEAEGPGSVAQTGLMLVPSSSEAIVGGHEVCAVDYELTKHGSGWTERIADDILDFFMGKPIGEGFEGYLWVLNSWGDQWGASGLFKMPFAAYLKLAFGPIQYGTMTA